MWKEKLTAYTKEYKHPAWGYSHFERVYHLSLQIAEEEKIRVDQEVLYAAAMLHDIGALPPYQTKGIDHAERSAQVFEEILVPMGFPSKKIELVRDIILGHMFYAEPSDIAEAIIFHDADTLEFMGYIGITRMLSVVGLDDWTPDLKSAVGLIMQFRRELPGKLKKAASKKIGQVRTDEMEKYIAGLIKNINELSRL
ncbi:MAG: HD domain-containing protein [Bacillota bacterium]